MLSKEKRKKILFICLAESTHAQSWISLFEGSDFDIKIYGIGAGKYPDNYNFKVYSFRNFYIKKRRHRILFNILAGLWDSFLNLVKHKWLVKADRLSLRLIQEIWNPDIINIFSIDPASYVFESDKAIRNNRKLILNVLGSELTLTGYQPKEKSEKILSLSNCVIVDSEQSYNIAREYNNNIHIFPGNGGVSISDCIVEKERLIVWPKAYECPFSKALPVFEALKICWKDIAPCKIVMTAMIPETKMWLESLPNNIRKSCVEMDRIPRSDLLTIFKRAKVMLIPSLSDGIPVSLYEAMAYGVLPIVSPLETIKEVARDGENAIFARNLYPDEIADALVRSMNDDDLYNKIVSNNYSLVKKVADRDVIREKVVELYKSLV